MKAAHETPVLFLSSHYALGLAVQVPYTYRCRQEKQTVFFILSNPSHECMYTTQEHVNTVWLSRMNKKNGNAISLHNTYHAGLQVSFGDLVD